MSVIIDKQETSVIEVDGDPTTIIIQGVGIPGADGQGVPAGGSTGEVLAKASNTNYDTEWVDLTSKMIVTSIIFG